MFLEKYTGQNIPDESTLRKNYVPHIYFETLSSVRGEIQGGSIWVSIDDETTDVSGGTLGIILNYLVVGKLCDAPTNLILLNFEKIEKSNHQTIAKLFNDSMQFTLAKWSKARNVLLFVGDAALLIWRRQGKR